MKPGGAEDVQCMTFGMWLRLRRRKPQWLATLRKRYWDRISRLDIRDEDNWFGGF